MLFGEWQAQMMLEFYKNNPQALESIKGKIIEDKAVDFIFADATVKEKKVTPENLKEGFKEIYLGITTFAWVD